MTDFLLELRSEEIPARMQAKAREDLARLFTAELATAGLRAERITTYATPRRLALIAHGLPEQAEATAEDVKGPRTSATPQALEGFLRKTGLTQDQLVDRDGVWFAVIERAGRATADVLATAIPAIVRAFPWPKSMRWGEASASTESLRWVRPLQGIVALLGGAVVPFEIAGIASGNATVGHRFHSPGTIALTGAGAYVEQLRDAHVIVDQDERRSIIALGATMAARKAGLELVQDEGLLVENAGLTEWPVPLLGRFDEAFLDVPPEVIQLTARVNQKYFVCRDGAGALANAFICTANIDASDGGAKIVEGNRKVLAARLSDAKFFYDTDLKVLLEDQAKKLEKIVFHDKLGTVADKVDRVAKLARWLVEEGIVGSSPLPARREGPGVGALGEIASPTTSRPTPAPSLPGRGELADLAERAARLAKADLVTGMVGEFPELQGVMGGYYARAQGEDPRVADAIRDHYKPVPSKVEGPVGQGDDVPIDPVTVAVSLADKLDTLVGFFGEDLPPTGSRDPFALRRAAIAVLQLLFASRVRICLRYMLAKHALPLGARNFPAGDGIRRDLFERSDRLLIKALTTTVDAAVLEEIPATRTAVQEILSYAVSTADNLLDFFADRLKVQQREAGVRHDLIDAVFALGGEDDLVRLLARVHALQAFVATEDGANLLAGYKRAANILKKEGIAPLPARREGPGVGASPDHDAPATGRPTPDPSLPGRGEGYAAEPAEAALIAALDSAEPQAAAAVATEDFAGAMAALATLRAPIDAFFTDVTVNDADPAKRDARLALLARVRSAVHGVADFSRIEG
ncbi:Glycine--tRNA ligase beta subunit [Sphingomonas sp. EC-HK361]|uniref:glycine--tRNA ligase subunit beta n=1 Tax=Sphingomonas sp. EC-HK361 TaxID=2038397 RepID=UPI00125B3C26|nr:glycine--tRNA ligase subunit beta [Sphingomonas sp. EC-HK361]VVT23508.1 Glycine--tRNA ligase beta subunit [Sphingomonas sp. EC-HK361]